MIVKMQKQKLHFDLYRFKIENENGGTGGASGIERQ